MEHKIKLSMKLLLIAVISFFNNLSAQLPQLKLWTLPPNQIAFNPLPTSSLLNASSSGGYFGQTATFASNSMHDASGNLLFYIVDNIVYDKDGYVIDELKISGTPLSIGGSGSPIMGQEISIVPKPGSCTQYYIITSAMNSAAALWEPVYTMIDVTLQNINYLTPLDPSKKGALQYFGAGTNVFDLRTISPALAFGNTAGSFFEEFRFGMAVTPLRSLTNNHFMYLRGFSKNLYRYIIDATGITFDNGASDGGVVVIDPTNTILNGDHDGGSNQAYPEMEIVDLGTGSYQLAYIYGDRNPVFVKLNSSDGLLSTGAGAVRTFNIPGPTQIRGLEFSPNGSYIYYSYANTTSHIGFCNLTPATLVPTEMLNTSYSGANTLGNSFIELGYDGKLYYTDGNKLLSLANPNSGPSSTNWTSTALVLSSSNLPDQTLPDQLDGNIYTGGAAGTIVTIFTAATSSLFPSTTQIWTPTSNPFGGTITSPVGTLANPIVVLDKLIIPSEFNITIQGMRFEFAGRTYDPLFPTTPVLAGASVQLLRSNLTTSTSKGARLTLDNSIFTHTNSCRTGMWEGIEVQGKSTASQGTFTTGKQAWLIVKNSSIVENAYHAVVMARVTNTFNGVPGYSTTPAIDLAYSGGVVAVTTGSRFRNNYIDVYFGNYDYLPTSIDNNASNFDNCVFETTPTTATTTTLVDMDANLNLANWFHHILVGVKGITYRGVIFQNANPLNPAYDILTNKRGSGIFSFNSYFISSQRFAPPFNRGKFNDLTYGVYAANFGSTKTFTITENDFTNNYRGIYAGSVDFETITKNTFKVYKWPMSPPTPTPSDAGYGIYLDFCKGFKVEENDFSYAGTATPMANCFGVIINNSNYKRNCTQHDEIYRNTFHNILVGGRAQGNNSERDFDPTFTTSNCYAPADIYRKNYIGFEFLCNTFSSNVDNSDLSVTRSQNLVTTGNIAYLQGDFSSSTLTPAGNTFSHTGSAFDFFSQPFPTDVDGTIVYVSHNDPGRIPNTVVTPPVLPQVCATCGTFSLTTTGGSCPSRLTGLHTPVFIKQDISNYGNQAASLETQIDGGNTTYLLSQIYGSSSAGTLKNLLMSKSPLLSDRVLIAYISKIGVPNGNLKDVVIANSPVTKPVMDALNSISLPNGIRNQINNAQTGVSARLKLESQIAYNTSQRAYNIDELIRAYANDTLLDNGQDSILAVFKTYNIQQNSTDIILAYLTKGDYVKTAQLNDSIKDAGTDTTFTKMVDVALLLKQSVNQEGTLLTDLATKTKVDEISYQDSKESPSANAVLKLLFNYVYNEYIEPISWTASYHSMFQMVEAEQEEDRAINLYPNPSSGEINFSYSLEEGDVGLLEIFDIAGKKIRSIELNSEIAFVKIENNVLQSGTYLYKYSVNGKVSKTDKLIIIK